MWNIIVLYSAFSIFVLYTTILLKIYSGEDTKPRREL